MGKTEREGGGVDTSIKIEEIERKRERYYQSFQREMEEERWVNPKEK